MRVAAVPVVRIAAVGVATLVLLVTAPIAVLIGRGSPATAGPPAGSGIPPIYMGVYAAGERAFHVNRWLLAAIHYQETRFSTMRAPSLVGDAVTGGWNACGAAGPMQMGIVGVPPYHATAAGGCSAGATWTAHRNAFRRAARWRPADYPLRRDRLAGCFALASSQGCVYDDFDAILGTAHKLRQDGADLDLDSPGTRRAVCAYIGACAAADTYYAVIPRAKQWQAMAQAGQPLGLQEGVGRSGLIWPVVGPVVSPYGMRWGRMHEGIDIAAPAGTPILAAADGQVVLREWFGGYGRFTCVRHAVGSRPATRTSRRRSSGSTGSCGAASRSGASAARGIASGHICTLKCTWRERGQRMSGTLTRSRCCHERLAPRAASVVVDPTPQRGPVRRRHRDLVGGFPAGEIE